MRPITRILVWSLPFALALAAAGLLHERTQDLLSAGPAWSHAFDDRASAGSSQVSLRTDSGTWVAAIRLRTGFQWPYVGVGQKFLAGSLSRTVDAEGFDSLVLVVASRRQKSVRLQMKVYEPGVTDTTRPLSFLLLEQGMAVDPLPKRRSVPLDGFTVPLWWENLNNLAPTARPNWKRALVGLEVINGMDLTVGVDDTLEIRSMTLEGHRTWVWAIFPLMALGLSGLVDRRFRPGRTAPPASAAAEPAPPPFEDDLPRTAVELGSHRDLERQRLLAWMGRSYVRQDLSVELAGREVGIHPRRIPGILKDATARTFPAQINEFRLLEASRLLRETDRTFSEIAQAVGVANVPHLHRLFKARFGATPGEWRANSALGAPASEPAST